MEKSFKQKVLDVVRKIPRGNSLSYGEVARRAGNPRACRAVGNIMNRNFDPGVPCHRVVGSNGRLGGYRDGVKRKKEILREEGVEF